MPHKTERYESGEAAVDMTKRLYETEPKRNECAACVQSCVQGEKGWLIELDQTVLFPEGGGQLCDRGCIDGMPVQDVYEENGRVIHLCSAPLQEGACVSVTLDQEVRAYHSQQHTGEHILSHAFWKLFGAKNIGFHSDERQITIDLDMELDREQCARSER
jgi:alanyl-tRNA synthetase